MRDPVYFGPDGDPEQQQINSQGAVIEAAATLATKSGTRKNISRPAAPKPLTDWRLRWFLSLVVVRVFALGRRRELLMQRFGPRRPIHQLAAAIGASVIKRFGTRRAEGAFKAADERTGGFGCKAGTATFTIRAHF